MKGSVWKINTLVVNLFGGPGCGKSTLAADIFAKLKWENINAELVTEFAKDLVWEERFNILTNQIYVLGKQMQRIDRLIGKVDVIITDSPILLSNIYNKNFSNDFNKLVFEIFAKYNNLNYYIQRIKPFHAKGRMQTESQAMEIDIAIKYMLMSNKIQYNNIKGEPLSANIVVQKIINKIGVL